MKSSVDPVQVGVEVRRRQRLASVIPEDIAGMDDLTAEIKRLHGGLAGLHSRLSPRERDAFHRVMLEEMRELVFSHLFLIANRLADPQRISLKDPDSPAGRAANQAVNELYLSAAEGRI